MLLCFPHNSKNQLLNAGEKVGTYRAGKEERYLSIMGVLTTENRKRGYLRCEMHLLVLWLM